MNRKTAISPEMAIRLFQGFRQHAGNVVTDAQLAYDLAQARSRHKEIHVRRLYPAEARRQ
ncbi:MAG TPA: hypothetical protein VG345_00255 [Bryobacteraceae bacterium]|nr:hypothetical protein [Bryobacteraceae bacterium]